MRKDRLDLTGMAFDRWMVLSPAPNRSGKAAWLCRCSCGAEREVTTSSLRRKQSRSCGCLRSELKAKSARKQGEDRTQNLTGRRFGKLVVEHFEGYQPRGPLRPSFAKVRQGKPFQRMCARWRVRCDCGAFILAWGSELTKSPHGIQSCGCSRDTPKAAVYFARVASGPIKIGMVTSQRNIKGRMNELQVSNHEEVTLLGIISGGAKEERRLHRMFAHAKIRGEWFHPTPELVALIEDVTQVLSS